MKPTIIAVSVWLAYGHTPTINLHAKWYWREVGPFRAGQLSLVPL